MTCEFIFVWLSKGYVVEWHAAVKKFEEQRYVTVMSRKKSDESTHVFFNQKRNYNSGYKV